MNGKLSITRRMNGDGSGIINLTMIDENSGAKFLDAEIDLASFAEALTGLARVDVEYELENLEIVGRTRETKRVFIAERKTGVRLSKADVAEGWQYWSGYGNHHNSKIKNDVSGYECTVVRYLDEPDNFPEE